MAFPLLLPLLFAGGSIAANSIAASRQASATAAAMSAERRRQSQLDEEAYALNNAAQARYEDAGEQTAERSDSLAEMFTAALDQPPAAPIATAPQTSSNLIVSRDAAEGAQVRAEGEDRAQRLGNVRGFGNLMWDLNRQLGRTGSQVGMLGGFKRASQNVLPLELQAAAQKGQGWMMLGDLLNMGAGLMMPGSLLAPGAAASSLAPATSAFPKPNPFY